MSRPLRLEYENAWYHVLNRGNARAAVFQDADDYELFLDQLTRSCTRLSVAVHAYVLMTNHFHLFINTRLANLSRFMHYLQSVFVQRYNLKHGRSGHLFQGRFKAWLVERGAYGRAVSRYIHLNPVRVHSLESTSIAERRRVLRHYEWSSYPAYIGRRQPHEALVLEDTLREFGDEKTEQRRSYAKYVEEGLVREVDDPFDDAVGQCVLGSEEFISRVGQRLGAEGRHALESRPVARRLTAVPLEEVKRVVKERYGVREAELCARHTKGNEARRMAMWLAGERCAGAMTFGEIGKELGGVTRGTVSRAIQRMGEEMARNRSLRQKGMELRRAIADATFDA